MHSCRRIPRLEFRHDSLTEKQTELENILDSLKAEREMEEAAGERGEDSDEEGCFPDTDRDTDGSSEADSTDEAAGERGEHSDEEGFFPDTDQDADSGSEADGTERKRPPS